MFLREYAMRITLVISSLEAGGAERVMSTMANYWSARDRQVTILTLSSEAGDWYGLDTRIKRVGLNLVSNPAHLGEALQNTFKRVARLRRELCSSLPDVVISFGGETNILTLLASAGTSAPVIVSERVDARHHSIGLVRHALRYLLYRRADGLVVQSHAARDWGRKLVGSENVHVIPNPVAVAVHGVVLAAVRPATGRTVVAMGRLAHQKGFDHLLRAFAKCARKHAAWSLVIIGEGHERTALERLIAELELKDRVTMAGLRQTPARLLQQADLFVMSSRYEGFPNALLEAMACGLAVISTDCPNGPREIIRDGVDGVLVQPEDSDALAAAMDRLMDDQRERERLGARAVEVRERFGIEKIMSMWDDLLAHTCGGRAHD